MGRGNGFPINDNKSMVKFPRRNIFSRFGTARNLISDEGSHFCSKQLEHVLSKYSVRHRIAIAYHLQASGKDEISN